jgi:hypothetical protein
MKTIFTLVASLFLSAAVFANDAKPKSTLTVKSNDMGDVRVVLDGKRFESNTNTVTISDLNAGYHTIKIYHQKNTGLFSILNKRYEVVYNTSLNIKASTMVQLNVDRFGKTTMTESKIRGGRFDRNWSRDDRDFDFDHDGQMGDYDNGYAKDNSYTYSQGMNDRDFSQVLQSISKEWLESNKLKSATQIATTNSLTSAQVKQMVLMFNIESNKLALSKDAYRNTVDKKNYSMIYDVFSFNSSKDDLARYIRSFH